MWALVAGSPFAVDQGNYTQDSAYAYPSSRYAPTWIVDSAHDQILFQGGEFVNIDDQFMQCSNEWLLSMKNYSWRLVINEACAYNPPDYGTYRVSRWRSASASFLIEHGAFLFSGNDYGDLWKLDFAKLDSVASSTEITSTSASIFTEMSTTLTTMQTTTLEATTVTLPKTTLIDTVTNLICGIILNNSIDNNGFCFKSSFRVTSKLSQGGGGEVYLADALDDRTRLFGNVLAVKRIKVQSTCQKQSERQMKLFEQELSVMAMLRNHKNIAKMVGYCRSESYSILMKYHRMGSLDKFIQNDKNVITKSLVAHFILDIASGISALHQNDLSHSDIKTANVLIDIDEEGFAYCVLTDFGITQVLSLNLVVNGFNVANIRGLSFPYASPETFKRQKTKSVLSDSPDTFKAGDVYAWGSILYELSSRQVPWSGDN
ncbi:hypothetical protein MP638_004341 [Amoeboaphelidium occidentale]|nr:hypothetical protein MP638_004341 [Amoeboaphelidium occidentale]